MGNQQFSSKQNFLEVVVKPRQTSFFNNKLPRAIAISILLVTVTLGLIIYFKKKTCDWNCHSYGYSNCPVGCVSKCTSSCSGSGPCTANCNESNGCFCP